MPSKLSPTPARAVMTRLSAHEWHDVLTQLLPAGEGEGAGSRRFLILCTPLMYFISKFLLYAIVPYGSLLDVPLIPSTSRPLLPPLLPAITFIAQSSH